MTEQQQQRAFFIVLIATIILFANVAGETEENGANRSAVSEAQILGVGSSLESNGTTSSKDPKSADKNGDLNSDKVVEVRESIIGEENDREDETPDEEDEYEGEDEVDEYAEELRAAAESHEAMSRHDKQAKNQSEPSGDHGSIKPPEKFETKLQDATKKDFDSREKSVESGSDESESSNETVIEGVDPEDEEVTELIKYKNSNNYKLGDDRRDESVKRKRVPTVKKELSTQTEIKTTNVSKVEKRFSTKEMLDELNKQFKYSMGYTEKPCDDKMTSTANEVMTSDKIEDVLEETENDDYFDRSSGVTDKLQADSKLGDMDSEELEVPRKLDKRQEAVLRDLETYLRAEYAAEQEQQQKLQELGAQEGALAESLLELLVKLAENPRRWERVHRLLMDVEGGLELSRQALEARKRAFNLTSVVTTTTTTSPISTTPKKPRKKPKKKKKKQRHHRFSTTTTAVPTTIPLLTTTESPWLTTPMQWRLVAERLFGPPWPQDLQDDPGVAKVRFTVPSNSRTSPPSREFVDQLGDSKQLQDHKALNTERQALMLESSREYTQPRHLHYGKVNTHQGVTSHRESSAPSNYHPANRDTPRVRDYDPPEQTSDYDMARYGQYDYPRSRIQGEEFFPVQSYAQNHEYRPPGREYAASKSWHDTQYKYGRPSWKSDDRGVQDSSDKWTWPQLEEEPKTSWHRVPNERDYWPRVQHENEGKVWPQSQRIGSEGWGRVSEPDSWTKTSWSGQESPKSQYSRYEGSSPPWENAKSRSETTSNLGRVGLKDATPKIGMKGWNGLASDQGSWPFKITETKQWQKNSDEKSYGKNSPLVRKLGFKNAEKEAFEKSLQMDTKNNKNNAGKYKSSNVKANNKVQKISGGNLEDGTREQVHHISQITSWNSDMDTNPKIWPSKTAMSPKIQSVGAWVMPVDQSTWKPYKLKPVDQFSEHNDGDSNRHRWNVQMDTNPRTWPPKMGETEQWNKFSKPNNGVTWPKWKQFAYHRVTAMPILSQGASLQDGSRARNNAYIAVSAVSPKYNGNQWRKNDIEETPIGQTVPGATPGLQDAEHPVSQLREGAGEPPAIYTWKKNAPPKPDQSQIQNQNSTDPLEEQLETLRRGTSWSHNENRDNIKKQLTVISDASETLASRFTSNSSANKPEESEYPAAIEDGTKVGKIYQNKEVSHK